MSLVDPKTKCTSEEWETISTKPYGSGASCVAFNMFTFPYHWTGRLVSAGMAYVAPVFYALFRDESYRALCEYQRYPQG